MRTPDQWQSPSQVLDGLLDSGDAVSQRTCWHLEEVEPNNGNRFALGWSAQNSRSVRLGKGLARQVFRAKIFTKHITILRGRWLE
ncbi:hypothetical protein [Actinophytocola sp.]|uniref:hypothetical protein n=1 Tax=Actinophytocola sp. TaxID=1872138 RepID=UPI002ED190EC